MKKEVVYVRVKPDLIQMIIYIFIITGGFTLLYLRMGCFKPPPGSAPPRDEYTKMVDREIAESQQRFYAEQKTEVDK